MKWLSWFWLGNTTLVWTLLSNIYCAIFLQIILFMQEEAAHGLKWNCECLKNETKYECRRKNKFHEPNTGQHTMVESILYTYNTWHLVFSLENHILHASTTKSGREVHIFSKISTTTVLCFCVVKITWTSLQNTID